MLLDDAGLDKRHWAEIRRLNLTIKVIAKLHNLGFASDTSPLRKTSAYQDNGGNSLHMYRAIFP